jgi:phosphoglycolate phosphatase-like HAD superfamily hydrolase
VENIKVVLLEPVGCLAEFRADEFDAAARELLGAGAEVEASSSGAQAYWRLVDMIGQRESGVAKERLESLETAAVELADLYEDVLPSLEKLRKGGVEIYLVSSLSRAALTHFIGRHGLASMISGSVSRDDAQSVGIRPLQHALAQAKLDASRSIYLADTAYSLDIAKQSGVNALLMINDYDEGRALAECNPIGGVVSLAELSDMLELIEQRAGLRGTQRMPQRPYELFEPG